MRNNFRLYLLHMRRLLGVILSGVTSKVSYFAVCLSGCVRKLTGDIEVS